MSYKRYRLTFYNCPADLMNILKRYVDMEYQSLGVARSLGRAARELFKIDYKIQKITLAGDEDKPIRAL